ncbi:MAG: hypothetical protein IT371_00970 [Deltaproteobacteria bacterium]|nr:hypothetical protein [Deltaproteobacteria bacterium]
MADSPDTRSPSESEPAQADGDGGNGVPPSSERAARYHGVLRAGAQGLACVNAPNISLMVERGLEVTSQTRRRYANQTIFLDGAYVEAPFFDNESRQYSLDHHAGCVRAFTLATCEQAAVMLLDGLPLDDGDWQLYVNDPDLDALLAAWLLMNHTELLKDDAQLLGEVMPFVRVQGVIDGHGLHMRVLTGFSEAQYREQKGRIDAAMSDERRLKARGEWATMDFTAYTRGRLEYLDELLFPAGYLARLLDLKEVARLPIGQRKLAFLCQSQQGIYAVEDLLKERYEKQVGVIVLDLGGGRFTLRQVDPFLPRTLEDLYTALNLKDPRAEGRPENENRWGGSADIGGSPRRTGSGLEGPEVLSLVQQVYSEAGWFTRLMRRLKTGSTPSIR